MFIGVTNAVTLQYILLNPIYIARVCPLPNADYEVGSVIIFHDDSQLIVQETQDQITDMINLRYR